MDSCYYCQVHIVLLIIHDCAKLDTLMQISIDFCSSLCSALASGGSTVEGSSVSVASWEQGVILINFLGFRVLIIGSFMAMYLYGLICWHFCLCITRADVVHLDLMLLL